MNFLEKWTSLKIWNYIWFVFFFLLPVTSMPAVVNLVHSDVVAAPSGIILIIVIIGWVLPKLFLDARFSKNTIPLIGFVLVSIIVTGISFFTEIPFYKQNDPLRASLSAIITLLVGFGFFISAMTWVQNSDRLKLALRAINTSGGVVLLWTFLQAFYWYTTYSYPEWMREIQFTLSVGSLYRQRFVGFALEPSWLAHQLNLLYLPWWLAASVSGYSVHQQKFRWLTFERLLCILGIITLYLTLSRVGLVAFILVVLFYLLYRLVHFAGNQNSGKTSAKKKWLILLGIFVILPLVILFILWTLTKLDFRMAQLFTIDLQGRGDPIQYLAEKLSLAARFVYWEAGIKIFADHPLIGVGLGHAGFYLPEALSAFALQLVEVRDLLFRSDILLNTKSLWVRLLAETGIIGFAFFIGWLIRCWGTCWHMIRSALPVQNTLGWMGCFTLVALLMEGFSLDTFALPYFWISLGMVGGSEWLSAKDTVAG